jgi:hypothetical protein
MASDTDFTQNSGNTEDIKITGELHGINHPLCRMADNDSQDGQKQSG